MITTVKVTNVFAAKDDGWCSFRAVNENGESMHFCGVIGTPPKPGMLYELEAEQKITKFGLQYQIKSAAIALPDDTAGIYEYLISGNIKGIGKSTASKIMEAFGKDALRVIHEEPEQLLQIHGISQKKLSKIISSSEENRTAEEIYRVTRGAVTKLQAKKLYDQYGKETVNKLREDPYKTLYQLDNIGFLKADKVALGCGIEEFSLMRTTNAVLYVLNDVITKSGDCYVPTIDMEQEALLLLNRFPASIEKIRGAKKRIMNNLDAFDQNRELMRYELKLSKEDETALNTWLNKSKKCINAIDEAILSLISQELVLHDAENDTIASKKIYDTEASIARMIQDMLKEQGRDWYTDDAVAYIVEQELNGNAFNDEQKIAFARALKHRLSILTGGPGCGKTTAIALVAGYWSSIGGDVYLMAPTGRAAQRIKESINEQLPNSGFRTSTIHYILANEDEKLEMEELDKDNVLIICDESSMVDIKLASAFLNLVQDFRVMLVGDADQLPPVGAGNFFRDLISTGKVPTTWLMKNYRSTGNIIDNSIKIKNGVKSLKELKTGTDFAIISLERENIAARIVDEYMNLLDLPDTSIRDISVLTLQRSRGAASVATLNQMIQDAYNPAAADKPEYDMQNFKFRLGDRVIHVKNNYGMYRITSADDTADNTPNAAPKGSYGVFNGDLGVIIAFNPDYSDSEIEGDEWVLCVEFDDKSRAYYKETELLQLELAYAMTVHKAQGSEFRYVIGTYAMDQYTMLFRAIVYTSETRAKKKYLAVCEPKALSMAIRNVGSSKRNTFLPALLA